MNIPLISILCCVYGCIGGILAGRRNMPLKFSYIILEGLSWVYFWPYKLWKEKHAKKKTNI